MGWSKKIKITWDWPVEKGHYLTSNPFSPVAVAVILTYDYEKIPVEINNIVQTSVEKGASIAGTLQTANIGIEKIILNIISNPNIRWLILTGQKSIGHKPDDALKSLMTNGINNKGYIINTYAPTAILKNIPLETVERFRRQVKLIDLIDNMDIGILEKAVWSCYQEKPVLFQTGQEKVELWDMGAYPEEPIIYRISDKLKGGDL
ncbi:hypothetical protein COY52_11030 [Candidatus Desantisbacteria bacterium CG_4_10_14_0_8_um_filter_48_22]|uniref:Tetrahydromethanopterin S-methyltransferase subunit A n=1 Tax=Candidatus Desantisbacteria bacterium CG_4_10_14_0_8_um_filter_48_22 TaxID=1974543 RepID=A0A2M7S642_9BACT|nr:MAG: hypothetical protein COS16_01385 [Candidatus Desantisbacteria bacterium CG02_land_8_20_14_3_00_49_13]PIZ14793.1 MAG: hypothetical protein COY52_11030 [Candidatus Desantisbacteria bacterium CG_4_10_14_0_8_um_filter_48_22]